MAALSHYYYCFYNFCLSVRVWDLPTASILMCQMCCCDRTYEHTKNAFALQAIVCATDS